MGTLCVGTIVSHTIMQCPAAQQFAMASLFHGSGRWSTWGGMGKWSSEVVDFGTVVHAAHLHIAAYGLLAWFEHVDSAANPADGGSRLGVRDPVASLMGVTLREVHLPPWPSSVRFAPASAWLHMLGSRE